MYKKLIAEHPDTPEALEARRRVGEPKKPKAKAAVQYVVVTDVNIGFMNMVGIFVKAAFAIIPAAIIVVFIWFMLARILAAFGGLAR